MAMGFWLMERMQGAKRIVDRGSRPQRGRLGSRGRLGAKKNPRGFLLGGFEV